MNIEKGGDRAPWGWRLADVAVVFVFAISRVVYRVVLGVRFDASPPDYFVQYLDPWFAEHDFARSVLYLHHQAPLQILIVQGCIKLLGTARATVLLQVLYLAFGVSLPLALLRVFRSLGAPILLAVLAVTLFMTAPSYLLYENWLFYPLPTASLVTFALLALLRYYRYGTFGAALAFFSLLGAVGLLRSTFGSLFLCAAAGLLLLRPPYAPWGSARRTILKAVALPLLIVMLNTAKTSWLTGHSYGSALLWQNLCVKIVAHLPPGERERLTDAGVISNAAGYGGMLVDVSAYGRFRVPHAPTGVPLLDLDTTPAGGRNTHALAHVLVAEKYYRPDAIYFLKHYPAAYLQSVWDAVSTQYVSSPALVDVLVFQPNFQKLEKLRSVTDRPFGPIGEGRFLALIVGLPLAWLYGLHRIFGARAALESERASAMTASFMLLTIGYAATVTLLVSFGDFARYRFDVDPLYLVLLVLLVADAGRGARRGLAGLVTRLRDGSQSRAFKRVAGVFVSPISAPPST